MMIALSCDRTIEVTEPSSGKHIVDGMLEVEFTVHDASFQEETKAFSLNPDIRTLKVVVFDNHGVYISQCDAQLTDTGNGTGTYSANFPVSDKDEMRIVHFLGNYTDPVEYGTELEIISQLITRNKVDGYWQRVEVDNLKAVEQNGEMVLVHHDQLDNVTLIRNYCAFTISTDPAASHLDIEVAEVYNVPDRGSIAPYSSDKSGFVGSTKGGFITAYEGYSTPSSLIADGYNACVPINSELTVHSGDQVLKTKTGETITVFSYERETPIDNPPFILVGGKWGATEQARASASTTYYKINLRDTDDNYFPLLRNFNYKINIKEVKQEGSLTREEAASSAGSGDISTDIRYNGLTEISNGEAKMVVTHTEVMLVTADPFDMKFMFIPDITSGTSDNGSNVTITLGPAGSSGAVFSGVDKIVKGDSDDAEGYRSLRLTPNTPDAVPKKQNVVITGTYTDPQGHTATIARTVTFLLHEKPSFTAQVLDSGKQAAAIAAVKETEFYLRVGIPAGLTSSIFPLNLEIESDKNSITPAEHLPVHSSKSRFNDTKPAIVYRKDINFSAYSSGEVVDGMYYVDVHFKTNKANSACSIRVDNQYFVYATATLTNP